MSVQNEAYNALILEGSTLSRTRVFLISSREPAQKSLITSANGTFHFLHGSGVLQVELSRNGFSKRWRRTDAFEEIHEALGLRT